MTTPSDIKKGARNWSTFEVERKNCLLYVTNKDGSRYSISHWPLNASKHLIQIPQQNRFLSSEPCVQSVCFCRLTKKNLHGYVFIKFSIYFRKVILFQMKCPCHCPWSASSKLQIFPLFKDSIREDISRINLASASEEMAIIGSRLPSKKGRK